MSNLKIFVQKKKRIKTITLSQNRLEIQIHRISKKYLLQINRKVYLVERKCDKKQFAIKIIEINRDYQVNFPIFFSSI